MSNKPPRRLLNKQDIKSKFTCLEYNVQIPSQTRSRSLSVIREESGSSSTARPISRSSPPASSTGAPSHGDQEMGDVLEMLAQPLVLNMLEGPSNMSENLRVILPALNMIRTWIYTHTEHPGTTPISINLSGIRRNAMRIADHIDSLLLDFAAQGEDLTVRLPQQQPASVPGTSTSGGALSGTHPSAGGGNSMNVDPPAVPSGPITSRGRKGASPEHQQPAARVILTYVSTARKGAAVLEVVIAMARAAPTLPAD
ncbi:hypothetical protein L218DRAFT_1004676 [Marasmius fiardii PR-910]|nr:hypothetical protein L218DRAFT_1004676 [Marasmius fiardii PR-910]